MASIEVEELAAYLDRYRSQYAAIRAERDALKQRVDDQAVAMTTALELLEGDESRTWRDRDAISVLAKALRNGDE